MKKISILLSCTLLLAACGPKSTIHPTHVNQGHPVGSTYNPTVVSKEKSSVPMRREGGVCYVVVKINGVDMEVIFDTGASDVVISLVEALFLQKQGKLMDEDVLGTSYYQVANGSISSGTVIRLKTVQIGSKILSDVRATVVDNMEAPLLLGQSALDRFESVSIDYKNNVINIE